SASAGRRLRREDAGLGPDLLPGRAPAAPAAGRARRRRGRGGRVGAGRRRHWVVAVPALAVLGVRARLPGSVGLPGAGGRGGGGGASWVRAPGRTVTAGDGVDRAPGCRPAAGPPAGPACDPGR